MEKNSQQTLINDNVHYLFDFEHDLNIYILNICECVRYVYYAYMHGLHFTVCLSVSQ